MWISLKKLDISLMAHWQWWWYFTLNLLMVLTRDNLSKHPATNRRGNRAHVAHKMDGRWDMYTLHYPLTTVASMTAEHGQNKETMAPVRNLYCDIIYSLYNQVELHRMHVNWHNILGYKMKVPVHVVQNYVFFTVFVICECINACTYYFGFCVEPNVERRDH